LYCRKKNSGEKLRPVSIKQQRNSAMAVVMVFARHSEKCPKQGKECGVVQAVQVPLVAAVGQEWQEVGEDPVVGESGWEAW
jgi:hypothetical protein